MRRSSLHSQKCTHLAGGVNQLSAEIVLPLLGINADAVAFIATGASLCDVRSATILFMSCCGFGLLAQVTTFYIRAQLACAAHVESDSRPIAILLKYSCRTILLKLRQLSEHAQYGLQQQRFRAC